VAAAVTMRKKEWAGAHRGGGREKKLAQKGLLGCGNPTLKLIREKKRWKKSATRACAHHRFLIPEVVGGSLRKKKTSGKMEGNGLGSSPKREKKLWTWLPRETAWGRQDLGHARARRPSGSRGIQGGKKKRPCENPFIRFTKRKRPPMGLFLQEAVPSKGQMSFSKRPHLSMEGLESIQVKGDQHDPQHPA